MPQTTRFLKEVIGTQEKCSTTTTRIQDGFIPRIYGPGDKDVGNAAGSVELPQKYLLFPWNQLLKNRAQDVIPKTIPVIDSEFPDKVANE